MAVGLFATYAQQIFVLFPQTLQHSMSADFLAYVTAGRIIATSHASHLFDLAIQRQFQSLILTESGGQFFGLLPFVNPPYVAWLFAPMASMPIVAAYYLWITAHLLIVGAILYLFATRYPNAPSERLLIGALFISNPFLAFTLWHGQTSALMLLGLTGFWLSWRSTRRIAGVWFWLACIKPQLWLLPATALLERHRRRACILASAGAIALFALTSAAFGLDIWVQYAHMLATLGDATNALGAHPERMSNLRMIWLTLYPDMNQSHIMAANYIILAAVMLRFVWFWLRTPPTCVAKADIWFGLMICAGLFLSPWLHKHDLLLAFIPTIIALLYVPQKQATYYRFSIYALYLVNLLWVQNPWGGVAYLMIIAAWLVVALRNVAATAPVEAAPTL